MQQGTQPPKVIVVGAGFGGLRAARALGKSGLSVLVLDRNNYHGFWPLLYQVATAGLEPEAIAYPVRAIFREYRNVEFRMAEVERVDFERKLVLTDQDNYPYDYLILAAGSTNNYFGNEQLARHTFGLKDIDEAEQLRNQVLCCFEQAVATSDPIRRSALLTFVIVGGGPTGVELAGAMAELFRHVLRKDYPTLDVSQARVILVEASDGILSTFPESLQRSALKRLREMGVEIRLGKAVESADGTCVRFKDGSELAAATTIWTAGVRGAALVDRLELPTGRGRRIPVTPYLNLQDRPEVFVIGDLAYLEGYREGQAYPMVAPVAIQQGELAAHNARALATGQQPRPFRYQERGNLATIGRRAAIMDAFGLRLSGRVAWIGWLVVHLIMLIGFRNRLVVLTNWAFNYFTYERGVRLITREHAHEHG
jgi:NADH:ubiquinone reductase (H+-translocating)